MNVLFSLLLDGPWQHHFGHGLHVIQRLRLFPLLPPAPLPVRRPVLCRRSERRVAGQLLRRDVGRHRGVLVRLDLVDAVDPRLQESGDPRGEVEDGDAEEEAQVAADLGHERERRVEVVLLAHHDLRSEVEVGERRVGRRLSMKIKEWTLQHPCRREIS